MYNPYRGRDTYAPQSGGGTRYARLPPVIELIPRWGITPHLSPHSDTLPRSTSLLPRRGYLLPHTQHILLGLLASGGGTRYARLPPVIEIIPLSGYLLPHTQAYPFGHVCPVGPLLTEMIPKCGAATPEGLHLDNRG